MQEIENQLFDKFTFGDLDNKNEIFISLSNALVGNQGKIPYVLVPFENQTEIFGHQRNAIVLVTIFIPEQKRRQGLCKQILDMLERKTTENGLKFVVGPLMSDQDDNSILADYLFEKRNYRRILPFSALYVPKKD